MYGKTDQRQFYNSYLGDSTCMVKGLQTGSRVRKDDGTLPLLTVNYYDRRGRVVETVSDNHLASILPFPFRFPAAAHRVQPLYRAGYSCT
ncbi:MULTISPECIES: hypothetical protein [unclassified Sphingobacterium]|uniref:hypothetical protein n=1 Tax=unclassified Sphingobacterium TaxID=2609468 RepID=UPI001FB32BED|nr:MULTISPECIES: hypothetical protein [unclassified Sphingobacterium]MCS3555054.1 hypothetical protein [Sphingobacterium sp. JUb21]